MSEETDALNNRIRQLENQVADMQRLVQDTSDLLDIARANGLDKFLTGHGLVEFGGGVDRLDAFGLQFNVSSNTPAMYFTPTFFKVSDTPNTTDYPYTISGVEGYAQDNSAAQVEMFIKNKGGTQAQYAALYWDNLQQHFIVNFDGNYLLEAVQEPGTSYRRVILGAPLVFENYASADPTVALTDGELWYRSDTDKFRARANGVTENLATESYVASGAGVATGFADHFLVMGG